MSFTWNFLRKLEKFIRDEALLQPGDRILVAVSGGVDSVVLLHALLELRSDWHFDLRVIHLNHGIRGAESDADEAFVRNLAEKAELAFWAQRADVPAFRAREKMGLEEAARAVRYAFYEEALRKTGFTKLALGHQQDDQAETILENLFRGAGLTGLRGMPAKRGAFVRPLLWARRSDILHYADANKLEFREDTSNRDIRLRRNWIRHELLPAVQAHFNPEIVKSLTKLATVAAEVDEFLVAEAARAVKSTVLFQNHTKIILDIHRFSNYFNSVQKYIFKYLLLKMGAKESDLTFRKYDALLKLARNPQKGRRVKISAEVEVLLDHSGLVIKKRQPEPAISRNVVIGSKIALPELNALFQISRSPKPEKSVWQHKKSSEEWVDANLLEGKSLHIRNWKPGDRFIPLGMRGWKKVSDFLMDEKVPLHRRGRILVLTAGEEIVWLVGFRLDERFKLTKHTKETIHLQMKKVQKNP